MKRPAHCTECGRSPVHARGLCGRCYRRLLRHANGENKRSNRMRREDSVSLLACPPDPELERPMFRPGAVFRRTEWRDTLEHGYWPDGSRWSLDGEVVEVRGAELVQAAD